MVLVCVGARWCVTRARALSLLFSISFSLSLSHTHTHTHIHTHLSPRYLGDDKAAWAAYDATDLIAKYDGPKLDILCDQVRDMREW
jgi:diadenosine tetraphosphate (Ap4A) HIT family hydrolase